LLYSVLSFALRGVVGENHDTDAVFLERVPILSLKGAASARRPVWTGMWKRKSL